MNVIANWTKSKDCFLYGNTARKCKTTHDGMHHIIQSIFKVVGSLLTQQHVSVLDCIY
jgi:hypothetical protein